MLDYTEIIEIEVPKRVDKNLLISFLDERGALFSSEDFGAGRIRFEVYSGDKSKLEALIQLYFNEVVPPPPSLPTKEELKKQKEEKAKQDELLYYKELRDSKIYAADVDLRTVDSKKLDAFVEQYKSAFDVTQKGNTRIYAFDNPTDQRNFIGQLQAQFTGWIKGIRVTPR